MLVMIPLSHIIDHHNDTKNRYRSIPIYDAAAGQNMAWVKVANKPGLGQGVRQKYRPGMRVSKGSFRWMKHLLPD